MIYQEKTCLNLDEFFLLKIELKYIKIYVKL